jgi:aryl-alcohol dehydrogenase-like predicted oxidoreductase
LRHNAAPEQSGAASFCLIFLPYILYNMIENPSQISYIVQFLSERENMDTKFGFGTWNFSGEQFCDQKRLGWPELPLGREAELLETAYHYGIRFFDTSSFYGFGRAEKILGEVLGQNQDVAIATKGGLTSGYDTTNLEIIRDFSPENIERSIDKSLQNLKRGYIDVYQLHGPDIADLKNPELWNLLNRRKHAGEIKAVGVSIRKTGFNQAYMNEIASQGVVEYVQLPSNFMFPAYFSAAHFFKERGKSLIGRSPFMHGLLLKDNIDGLANNDQRRDFFSEKMATSVSNVRSKIDKYRLKLSCERAQFIIYSLSSMNLFDIILFGASKSAQINSLSAYKLGLEESKAKIFKEFIGEVAPSLTATS